MQYTETTIKHSLPGGYAQPVLLDQLHAVKNAIDNASGMKSEQKSIDAIQSDFSIKMNSFSEHRDYPMGNSITIPHDDLLSLNRMADGARGDQERNDQAMIYEKLIRYGPYNDPGEIYKRPPKDYDTREKSHIYLESLPQVANKPPSESGLNFEVPFNSNIPPSEIGLPSIQLPNMPPPSNRYVNRERPNIPVLPKRIPPPLPMRPEEKFPITDEKRREMEKHITFVNQFTTSLRDDQKKSVTNSIRKILSRDYVLGKELIMLDKIIKNIRDAESRQLRNPDLPSIPSGHEVKEREEKKNFMMSDSAFQEHEAKLKGYVYNNMDNKAHSILSMMDEKYYDENYEEPSVEELLSQRLLPDIAKYIMKPFLEEKEMTSLEDLEQDLYIKKRAYTQALNNNLSENILSIMQDNIKNIERKIHNHSGRGGKRRSKKSKVSKKAKGYLPPTQDLARRLKVLQGEIGAGNKSKKIKNEINKIVNILVEQKKLSKQGVKKVMKSMGL